ncbi:hypothetical protein C8R48DRAFT_730341 [Suillus tomentosus]|nr:hypothetical protein C8R48DRAFT_730341 [Suillus tomentosus]
MIQIEIHQTDAQLVGSVSLNCKQSREGQNQTSSKPHVNAKLCSLSNERARLSSSGFEECGMCKHARLELVSIE